jgi:two-component system KDP operon response regulator KdpE
MPEYKPVVLAVDDESAILRLIKLELTTQGYRVVTSDDPDRALDLLDEQRPDLVLLDVMMPQRSGLELMQQIQDRRSVPVILLTGKSTDADKVKGLDLGADDYLVKPFSPDELSARVAAVLRRTATGTAADNIACAGGVEIDLLARVVTRDGKPVALSRTEWRLLAMLAANAGRLMLNEELLEKIWGPEYSGDVQYLRVWVSRLRGKLEGDPAHPVIITTSAGLGYMLERTDNPAVASSPESPEPAG